MALAFLPRQPQQSTEVSISVEPDLIAAINRWRMAQGRTTDLEQSIQQLLRRGLEGLDIPGTADIAAAEPAPVDPAVEAMAVAMRQFVRPR